MKLGTHRAVLFGAASAALAFLVVLAAPAFACSAQSVLTATATPTGTDAVVRVSGAGYNTTVARAADTVPVAPPVEIRWGGADGRLLAMAQVDLKGRFAKQVALPADATEGSYLVTAVQARSDGAPLKATFAVAVDASAAGGVRTPSQSAARLATDELGSFGSPSESTSSVAPWALAPAALLGGFAVVAGATVLTRETRQKAKAVRR